MARRLTERQNRCPHVAARGRIAARIRALWTATWAELRASAAASSSYWRAWRRSRRALDAIRETNGTFWKFIEAERNDVLKQYLAGAVAIGVPRGGPIGSGHSSIELARRKSAEASTAR